MRKSLLFVWACMGLVCLMSACKTSVKSKEWKLVWVEDFDQKNSFDESVWTKIPRGTSDWNNYMSYYDSCYAMQDGNLILRGIANHTQKNDTAPYLTGGVYTKGKKLFTGGRVEVCARLQAAKGAWPAIWMLPEKAEWPKGGEIDIMERLNHDHIAYQTTHSGLVRVSVDLPVEMWVDWVMNKVQKAPRRKTACLAFDMFYYMLIFPVYPCFSN